MINVHDLLAGGFLPFSWFHSVGISESHLTFIFSRGVETTNQHPKITKTTVGSVSNFGKFEVGQFDF
jgi:hypothetical protein